MKKILLLGGSFGQLPAIKEAKKRGLYTILCDYLTDNPGAKLTDEYYPLSTTDKEAVLQLARDKGIDFIFAYASDPAASTAAYVAEQLHLPGSSYAGVEILSNKDLFRAFLRNNGFNCPKFEIYGKENLSGIFLTRIELPLIVKPVDSSDTKGVSLVKERHMLINAAEKALQFSKAGRIIVEEFIDAERANFHGDGFVLDGNLVFCMLGDQLLTSDSNPLKPTGSIYPSRLSDGLVSAAVTELKQVIKKSGYNNGGVNLEVRINGKGVVYVMEIGPRNGGTLTPQAIYHASGFDMLGASFDYITGKHIVLPKSLIYPVICYIIHSQKDGVLEKIGLPAELKPFVAEEHLYNNPGEMIKSYSESNSSLGILIFKFGNHKELNKFLPGLFATINNSIYVI